MRGFALKLTFLVAIGWVLYANMKLLSSATQAISKTTGTLSSKLEMKQIALCVKMEYMDTHRLPKSPVPAYRDALRAAQHTVTRDTGKDKWGTYYRLFITKRGFRIVSPGPDRKWRTRQDNIEFHQTLTDVGYTYRSPQREPSQSRKKRRSR
ncbi:MAG: hypothetical protein HN742_40440 [Lentisphaerae bacterium]|nr:hypothetical protein [Lentisphaerota bacterium]MBT4815712.1 hypothetical protein [Lentisphaerota bacterium]MBT5610284.1 hypothetical protein [Lentisphaerota bacterium]MBT7059186.1 hypothetical protein [Lentisphaerota bacterium]MBT7848204.1 hypothetical protein [Lentisphaerota bacterium]